MCNYTYQPIGRLTVDLKLNNKISSAVSSEGKPVEIEQTATGLRLTLALDRVDLILLR